MAKMNRLALARNLITAVQHRLDECPDFKSGQEYIFSTLCYRLNLHFSY